MKIPVEVVISGISGRYPESENLQELISHLLSNKDLVSSNDRRFKTGTHGIPKGFGTLKAIDKFDGEVFGLLPKQADRMDPQLRIGLETTYEAMIDAGVNPSDERGTRTGVFTAVISHESTELWSRQPERLDGGNLIGSLGAMIPNRISYCFDFHGPSANYDTACSSSIFALEGAVAAIQSGRCDAAVVMGACLVLNPVSTLMRDQAGMLAKDATPRSYDPDGQGYVRAEAVSSIYLQRMCDAKRAYAVVVGVGSNTDGYKERGVFHPSAMMQEKLLEEVYRVAKVNPAEVTYVEGHGTGTPAGDPEEVRAISRHFCMGKNRKEPLLLGSIKSNMGHTEGASGLCQIAKIVGMLQTGLIPANLNYRQPHYSMKNIRDGKIHVVDVNTKWTGGLVGVNCFGFGGANSHLILKPITYPQLANGRGKSMSNINEAANSEENALKNLVTLSGRTKDGVEERLREVVTTGHQGQIHLLNGINKSPLKAEKFRGFGIVGQPDTVDVEEAPLQRPPLWFVFNGMGSQWIGMGRSLLQIPSFSSSFKKCCDTLAPFDYDLLAIYFSDDPIIFESPTNVFTSIGATQICLLDMLTVLGLRPDGMLGHSMGETLCAYADGCMNLEDTIISVYLRGGPCEELKKGQEEPFGMAVVPLEAGRVSKISPPGVYSACHNGLNSTTISGPVRAIKEFQSELKGEGIEVKEVNSCGIPFHSPYITQAAVEYRRVMEERIADPLARSTTWVSTSVTEMDKSMDGLLFGPSYLYNNFVSPVLFAEALRHIPENSLVIEIGPSGLLRGLIQKGVGKGVKVIPLQTRNIDPVAAFRNALGRIYLAGVNFDLNALIGLDIKGPLPGNTPLLGHLVDWDHTATWSVPAYAEFGGGGGIHDVSLSKAEDSYLVGHTIRGRRLFPAAGYLCLVWKYFAGIHSTEMDELPVVFEDVKFLRVTVLREQGTTEFRVNMLEIGGGFEVREGGAAVCTGKIRLVVGSEEKLLDLECRQLAEEGEEVLSHTDLALTSDCVYKRLRFLGYDYSGLFKGIQCADPTGTMFKVAWQSNWISFLDNLLQTNVRIYAARGYPTELSVPTKISKLLLNPLKFKANLPKVESPDVFTHFDPELSLITCSGIEIEGLKMTKFSSSRNHESPPVISKHAFDPYFYGEDDGRTQNENFTPLLKCMSIVMENFSSTHSKVTVTVPTILETCTKASIGETLQISTAIRVNFAMPDMDYSLYTDDYSESLANNYLKSKVKIFNIGEIAKSMDWMTKKYDLIVLDDAIFLHLLLAALEKGGFLILKLSRGVYTREHIQEKLDAKTHLVAHKFCEDYDVFLIRMVTKVSCLEADVVHINSSVDWVDTLRGAMLRQEDLQSRKVTCPRLFLVSNGVEATDSGVLGLTLCLRKEPFSQHIRCIFSVNEIPLDFKDPDEKLKQILDRDLVFSCVDEQSVLGCYIHSEISSSDKIILTPSAHIGIESPGDLSTLAWHQGPAYAALPAITGYLPLRVFAVGLNFKDVMIATGNLQVDVESNYPHCYQSPLGMEFSAMTKDGRRVCGITQGQAIATDVLVSEGFLWDIPCKWSFEEAATVPVAYSTAYLALFVRGKIQMGESILIHSGAGGVGIAAIRVALSLGCQIFATVGSEKKVAFLRSTFPEIPGSQIGYSRDTRFEQLILKATKGRGVDLILNSLSGDKMEASVRCLAPSGRFLEIGRVDLVKNKALGMELFLRNATFHGIQLDLVPSTSSADIQREIHNLVSEGMASGVVVPLPFRVFTKDQVEPAFRYMGQGSHTGKILVRIRQAVNESKEEPIISAHPRIYFCPEKVYLVLGGLGGVGLEFVNWLTLRNARHILISSTTGGMTPYIRNYLSIWEERGVQVHISTKNAIEPGEARDIFQQGLAIGPIGGIFNLTMRLEINIMKLQTRQSFQTVMDPKIAITRNMDELSRLMSTQLDHFVLFSSVSAALGYDGQGNYGFANSGAERRIERRVADGLPGRAIQWGAIGEVGVWHEHYNRDYQRTAFHGTGVQSISSVLQSLDVLLSMTTPVTLCRRTIDVDMSGGEGGGTMDEDNLMERIAHILGHANAHKLKSKDKLVDLGMDSIMSIEVVHVLEQDFGLELSASEIRMYTLEQLNEMSSNSRNQKATVVANIPKPKAATAGLFQLNFFKSITRSRFIQSEIVYPINNLAKDGAIREPHVPAVFICNSIEGPDVLRVLGALTTAPCYSLQFSGLLEQEITFEKVAQIFLEEVKRVAPVGPYVIAGLSAGVFPAYELAIKLQELGEMRKLIFLDMTFDRFSALMDENFEGRNIETLNDDEVLVVVHSQIFGFDKAMLERLLRGETTQEGKLDRMVELIQELSGNELDEGGLRKLFTQNWKSMFVMLAHYEPKGKFHQDVGLIKTTQNLIAYDSSEYWGLEKVCTKTPEVITVDTTHSYLIAEPAVRKVVDMINSSWVT